ncbi:MAG: hypothetical protein ACOZB3_01710 [Calditrichota bacterium]
MIRWNASLIAVLCLTAAIAYAQPFSASLIYEPTTGGDPLYTACDNTTPIPDGRVVKIFWDQDGDGPDETDPQPTVCTDPPLCELGPVGTVNFNEFTINGEFWFGIGGYFIPDLFFNSVNVLPESPRYYLRIYETDGTTVLWTSSVKTLTSGPQEVYWTRAEWTCGPAGPQCVVRDEHE